MRFGGDPVIERGNDDGLERRAKRAVTEYSSRRENDAPGLEGNATTLLCSVYVNAVRNQDHDWLEWVT